MTNKKATRQMTEFRKFVYFTGRYDDLKELKELWISLWCHADVSRQKFYPRINKEFGINAKQWKSYYSGHEPLPNDFLWRFKRIFDSELDKARIKKHNDMINRAIAENKRFTERAMKVLKSKQSPENATI